MSIIRLSKSLIKISNWFILLRKSKTKLSILIQADRGRISQVVLNLLSNALKFTEEGTIVITSEIKDYQNVLVVSVNDTGAGIDFEIMPQLFTKFASKSFAGTGLGLYICKNIIEAHGGKMWAKNNSDGKGSTFSFSLLITNERIRQSLDLLLIPKHYIV